VQQCIARRLLNQIQDSAQNHEQTRQIIRTQAKDTDTQDNIEHEIRPYGMQQQQHEHHSRRYSSRGLSSTHYRSKATNPMSTAAAADEKHDTTGEFSPAAPLPLGAPSPVEEDDSLNIGGGTMKEEEEEEGNTLLLSFGEEVGFV